LHLLLCTGHHHLTALLVLICPSPYLPLSSRSSSPVDTQPRAPQQPNTFYPSPHCCCCCTCCTCCTCCHSSLSISPADTQPRAPQQPLAPAAFHSLSPPNNTAAAPHLPLSLQIRSLAPLSSLTAAPTSSPPLAELYVAANKVTAIEPLGGLSQLTVLELGSNRIRTIEGLEVGTV
jgi:hypothetical protein